MPAYLVERFTPSLRREDVAAAVARLCERSTIRHLWTVLIPGEETCLSLVIAPDEATLATANAESSFPFARIVSVVTFATSTEPIDPTELID